MKRSKGNPVDKNQGKSDSNIRDRAVQFMQQWGINMAEQKFTAGTVVAICIAIATGSWAINGEVKNYRLQNITDRLKSHETYIQNSIIDRNEIWRAIDRLVDLSASRGEDLAEIKALIKNQ